MITTVGYGHLVPRTIVGRLFCIIYALLGMPTTTCQSRGVLCTPTRWTEGIPLCLITIADIGKFAGQGLAWAYDRWRQFIARALAPLSKPPPEPRSPLPSATIRPLGTWAAPIEEGKAALGNSLHARRKSRDTASSSGRGDGESRKQK